MATYLELKGDMGRCGVFRSSSRPQKCTSHLGIGLVLPQRKSRPGGREGWVSANNWVEVSSKQTTGLWGSYGSAYRSSTSSMLATNSAPTLEMHHSFFCHGLRAFF